MHARTSTGRIRFTTLLPLFALLAGGTVATASDDDSQARVERAALATYIHGMTDEIALREVGHAGLPALRALLRDPDFPRRDNVVAFMAHLGGATEREA